MRLASGLPDEFWAEAITTATYLANRSPSSSRNFKTPYEIRYGKPPCLSHLRVFGCQAWAHVPKVQRSKLEPRARPAVFVGYEQNRKGYCLFDVQAKEFFSSRDVIFDETSFPAKQWSKDDHNPSSDKFNSSMFIVPDMPVAATRDDSVESQDDTQSSESEYATASEPVIVLNQMILLNIHICKPF